MTDENNLLTDEELDKVAGGQLLASYWSDGKGGYAVWAREIDPMSRIIPIMLKGGTTTTGGELCEGVQQKDLKTVLDSYRKEGYTIELLDSRPKGIEL